ncbi:MAG TPA: MauE/DoxX family redox-associated membrane protein [Thermoanaerobaculia bacterium]|nr:MauE/DoxX family redox-associated membrane protein [Thermoanaerobaculia bacterium]
MTGLVLKWIFGLLFVLAGIAHFVRPDVYMKIMPPYLPWHRELVYLSGFFEIVLGVLFLIPRFTAPAAWGLIALLIAVFPANLHMARHAELYPGIPPVLLWLRLPLQGLLIAWAYAYTR